MELNNIFCLLIILFVLVFKCHAPNHHYSQDNAENFKRSKRVHKIMQNSTIAGTINQSLSSDKICNLVKLKISTPSKLIHIDERLHDQNKTLQAILPAKKTFSKNFQVKHSRHKRDISKPNVFSSNFTSLASSTTQRTSTWEDWLSFLTWSKFPIILSPLSETNEWKTYRSLFPTKPKKQFKILNISKTDFIVGKKVITVKSKRVNKLRLSTRYRKRKKMLRRPNIQNGIRDRQSLNRFDSGGKPEGRESWQRDGSRDMSGHMIPGVNFGIPKHWEYKGEIDKFGFDSRRDFSGRYPESWMRGDPGWGPGYGPANALGYSQMVWPGRRNEIWAKGDYGGDPGMGPQDIPGDPRLRSGFSRISGLESGQRVWPGKNADIQIRGKPSWVPGVITVDKLSGDQRFWPLEGLVRGKPARRPGLGPVGTQDDSKRAWPERNHKDLLRGGPVWGNRFGPIGELRTQRAWPGKNPEGLVRGVNWDNRQGAWLDKLPEGWIRGDPNWGSGYGPAAMTGNSQRGWPVKNYKNFLIGDHRSGPEFEPDSRQKGGQRAWPGRIPNGWVRDNRDWGLGLDVRGRIEGDRTWPEKNIKELVRGDTGLRPSFGPDGKFEDIQHAKLDKDQKSSLKNNGQVNRSSSIGIKTSRDSTVWLRGNSEWGRGYGSNNEHNDDSKTWPSRVLGDWVGDTEAEKLKIGREGELEKEKWVGGGPEDRWKHSFGVRLDSDLEMRYRDNSWKDPDWSWSQSNVEGKQMNDLTDPRDRLEGRLWTGVRERPIWGHDRLNEDSQKIDMDRLIGENWPPDRKRSEAVKSSIWQGGTGGSAFGILISDLSRERQNGELKQRKSSSRPRITRTKVGRNDGDKVVSKQDETTVRKESMELESGGVRQIEDAVIGDKQDIDWSDLIESGRDTQIEFTLWKGPEEWLWDDGELQEHVEKGDVLRGVTPLDSNSVESARRSYVGRCYTCGLNETGIPVVPRCYDTFDNDDHRFLWRKNKFMTNCYRGNGGQESHKIYNQRFIQGCYKRFTDIGGIYYEKGCRAWPPTVGGTVASMRFARLERLLRGVDDSCVFSPNAVLTPFARGISLWVRYHVCVCVGDLCNAQSKVLLAPSSILFTILAVTFNVWHNICVL